MTQCASRADGTRACDGNFYGRGPVGVLSLSGSHRNFSARASHGTDRNFAMIAFAAVERMCWKGKGMPVGRPVGMGL